MAGSDPGAKVCEWLEAVRRYRSPSREERVTLSPTESALLVIDMQRYFLDEDSHACVPAGRSVLENIRKLADFFRAKRRPVIFTRHALLDEEPAGIMERWWSDVLRVGDPLSEFAPEIAPEPSDQVLRKTRYSAFVGTDLDSVLRTNGVRSVVVTGVMTHLCCETTARDAFMRDFDVYFVVDGTASSDEELHLSSLRTLTDGFAVPVTTKEVLAWMSE
ncbi:MAG: cysteine hydrolase [Methanobacteriota archaeon]|nr:MAG: cysteine hydrolase [Euryarchaeota archaeon]